MRCIVVGDKKEERERERERRKEERERERERRKEEREGKRGYLKKEEKTNTFFLFSLLLLMKKRLNLLSLSQK